MNEELLNNLYDAYDFLHIDSEYRELIERFERDTEGCRAKYLRIKNEKVTVFPIYLGAFYGAMVMFIMGGLLTSQGEIGSMIGIILFAIGVLVLFISRAIAKKQKKVPENKAAEFWEKVGSPTCVENEAKIAKIEDELLQFRDKNKAVIKFLPEDYQEDIQAVGYMIHVIKNGLADTLKEALQLFNEQKHRWKMEEAMHGMAKNMEMHNQEMEAYMSEISAQQRIANSRLADIEMLTFLDYVNN